MNGDIALPGQFPYFVLLDIFLKGGVLAICGGGLITSRFVLTAAHCIHDAIKVECYFPIVDAKKPRQKKPVQAEKIIVHKGFDEDTLANDIALLKVRFYKPKTMEPIKLELPQINESFEGELVEIAGFGKYDSAGQNSKALRYYYPVVINFNECKKVYANQPLTKVKKTNICARMLPHQVPQTACLGDSGGPLVLVKDDHYIVIGIVSYGSERCHTKLPQIFTRVAAYTDWIEKKIYEN